MLNKIDRLWATAILFANGWIYALPMTDASLPIVFTPVQVMHGVFVHEVLLLTYLPFLFITRGARFPRSPQPARRIAFLLTALATVGVLSGVTNLRPLRELGSAGRYGVLMLYFLVAIYWSRKNGATFVLRNFLLGITAAGAVNLSYTFTINNAVQLGGLPFLLGEQGPGGYLGMAVVLSAWLMFKRRHWWDVAVAVVCCGVSLVAVSISFSKLGMLMAAAGGMAWLFVLWRDFNTKRMRRWYAVAMIVLAIIGWRHRDALEKYAIGARTFFDYKFIYLDKDSIGSRGQYFLITAEIVARHPLFGVGYGGFYDAATATEAYKSPKAAKEDPEAGARGESNPHSSFLYYTAANGLPGLLITALLWLSAAEIFRGALFPYGFAAKVLWCCMMFAYLVFGLTLPTLFNSSILYLPVAVAVCVYTPRALYVPRLQPAVVVAHA